MSVFPPAQLFKYANNPTFILRPTPPSYLVPRIRHETLEILTTKNTGTFFFSCQTFKYIKRLNFYSKICLEKMCNFYPQKNFSIFWYFSNNKQKYSYYWKIQMTFRQMQEGTNPKFTTVADYFNITGWFYHFILCFINMALSALKYLQRPSYIHI